MSGLCGQVPFVACPWAPTISPECAQVGAAACATDLARAFFRAVFGGFVWLHSLSTFDFVFCAPSSSNRIELDLRFVNSFHNNLAKLVFV